MEVNTTIPNPKMDNLEFRVPYDQPKAHTIDLAGQKYHLK